MAVLPQIIYRFNAILIRILADFSVDNEKLFQKFIWNCKGHRKTKPILKQKNKGTTFPNFKTYCKAMVIKTVDSVALARSKE